MSDSKNIKDELKKFAPDLLRMEKKEGYEVPPRYFDRLGDEVMHRIKMEGQAEKVKSPSLFDNLVTTIQSLLQPRMAMGLAAIALLLIGIQQFGFNEIETDPGLELASIESLTDEEFESYLAENIFDFEEELLDELALEGDLDILESTEGDEDLDGFFQKNAGDIDLGSLEELLL